jgi:peptide/nickel transport system substrate-binding protein
MLTRRTVIAAPVAALAAPRIAHAQATKTLRYVPQSSLAILDPMITTGKITTNHGYHVFDTLYAVDPQYRPQPQMAEGHDISPDGREWRIRLREGLRFHDTTPVRAQDCIASLTRWSQRDGLGQLLRARTDTMTASDDRTILIRLTKPFPALLDALAKPVALTPFIYPEHLANTPATEAIKEIIGSGPYRFVADEFVSGSRVVYRKFEAYIPRPEQPLWATGGKIAYIPRVEWRVIPDPATAAAALQAGEVDWVEQPLSDLLPLLRRNPDITIGEGDASGYLGIIRFNVLNPPFDNPAIRRAVAAAVNQADYMNALVGDAPGAWRPCQSLFACGAPNETNAGFESLGVTPDLGKAKAMLAQAGYNGETVAIINPADVATIAPMGRVTADLLQRMGMKVNLIEADFGSIGARLSRRDPPDKGGWSIYHTWWPGSSIVTPPGNALVRGLGAKGFAGWYENPTIETLIDQWLDAADPARQRALQVEIHRLAATDAATIPVGQFRVPTAYRSDLKGVLPGPATFPWNVRSP